jgi:hypothetical protein
MSGEEENPGIHLSPLLSHQKKSGGLSTWFFFKQNHQNVKMPLTLFTPVPGGKNIWVFCYFATISISAFRVPKRAITKPMQFTLNIVF